VSVADRLSRSEKQRLVQPLTLEDGKAPRVLALTLYALSAFIFASIIWASLAQIREMTSVPGQIVPRGQLHAIQHLEGGIVADIFVREGTYVQAGQPLFRIAPAQAQGEDNQLMAREAGLRIALIRQEAQETPKLPDFGEWGFRYPELARQALTQFMAEREQRKREDDALLAKVRQRESDAEAYAKAELVSVEQLALQREQVAIQESLAAKGYSARRTLLDAQAAYQRANADLVNIRGRLATALEAVEEARQQRREAIATAERKRADERAKAQSDLSETLGLRLKSSDRMDRLVLRASTSGRVQDISARSIGEVIRPGDIIGKIVPDHAELVAEVRIDPKDVGHISVGAPVDLKFSTFDPALFGSVHGRVESIAAMTSVPTPGQPNPGLSPASASEPYFKAVISLDKANVGHGGLERAIVPGMVVSAEIITGNKSIIRYMLKPVFRSFDQAFSER
jgi:adhesin transport system membrane fusion protein